MNSQIAKLFGLIVFLFALLLLWTTRWTVIDAKSLRNNPLNDRTLVQELRIKRGRILADNGEVLARSIRQAGGTWSRVYPTRSQFAQVVGYSLPRTGQVAGLELSRGEDLRGIQTGLSSIFGPFTSHRVGDDVYTGLDPKAQAVAIQQLAGRAGSVVALDPRTGVIKVMYANPSYDNNHPNATGPNISTFNRSTQSSYTPGSTFKIVTTTAALDSGKYTPNSTINGNSPKLISGVPLNNDGNKSWGDISLTTALTYSVNTVFAQVAQNVGRATMTNYMKRFGFYSKPPLDYPASEINVSRPYSLTTGRAYPPGSPNEDIGRIGIGQGGILVTPLQMAMVAAAVANHGVLMTPHFATKVVSPDGTTVQTISPSVYRTVMKPSTAAEITQMMKNVVEEGTAAPAQLGGLSVAGKTGTASVGPTGSNITEPWFIGFAPINNPRVAVAVTIERTQGGFGGTVAAPIAKQVIQTLLSEGQ